MNEWEWQVLEEKTTLDCLTIGGVEVKVGERVRLRPRAGGDVLDIALAGKIAVVEGIEQDYEGKIHLGVVLDEDPGRDMGLLRQPGHRFFFTPEEVEALPPEEARPRSEAQPARILVAGIGNIFCGDDGFGVEVAKRMASGPLLAGVRVIDFGIRGFDLAYAMQDGYETIILVDAYPHGQAPGTVSLIEPDLSGLCEATDEPRQGVVETHGMNPMNVLRMAKAMNGGLKKVLLVGCEPAFLGGEEGHIGLSEPVQQAVEQAEQLVASVAEKLLRGESELSRIRTA